MSTFRLLSVIMAFFMLVEGNWPGGKRRGDGENKDPGEERCKFWPCKDREWKWPKPGKNREWDWRKPDDKRKGEGEDEKSDENGCKDWTCKCKGCKDWWCKYWCWFHEPRDIEHWMVFDDMVKLKASQKTENYTDYLDFQIKVGAYDGIDTNFNYHLKPNGAEEKGKFDMSMKLFKIIEFKDAPGSAEGYDSNDEVVQEYILGSPKGGRRGKKRGEVWSPIKEVIDPASPDAKSFSAKTKDGVFEVIGRYAGKPVNFTKTFSGNASSDVTYEYHLMPTNIKFDYIIRDFPFMSNDSTLALEGRFKTHSGVRQHRSWKNALQAPADDGDEAIHGMFTWASTVDVDGKVTPVLFSLNETTADDDEEEVSKGKPSEKNMKSVWTFAHAGLASSFVWDPNLGVESGEHENPDHNRSDDNQSDDTDNMLSGASGLSTFVLVLLPVCALRISF